MKSETSVEEGDETAPTELETFGRGAPVARDQGCRESLHVSVSGGEWTRPILTHRSSGWFWTT